MLVCLMACDSCGGIAKDGVIPWHNTEDRANFYRIIGKSPIICGRKTFETLPEKLIGDRKIGILSRIGIIANGRRSVDINILHSINDLIEYITVISLNSVCDRIFLLGGNEAIDLCIDRNLIFETMLTIVNGKYFCDVFLTKKIWLNIVDMKIEQYSTCKGVFLRYNNSSIFTSQHKNPEYT